MRDNKNTDIRHATKKKTKLQPPPGYLVKRVVWLNLIAFPAILIGIFACSCFAIGELTLGIVSGIVSLALLAIACVRFHWEYHRFTGAKPILDKYLESRNVDAAMVSIVCNHNRPAFGQRDYDLTLSGYREAYPIVVLDAVVKGERKQVVAYWAVDLKTKEQRVLIESRRGDSYSYRDITQVVDKRDSNVRVPKNR